MYVTICEYIRYFTIALNGAQPICFKKNWVYLTQRLHKAQN